MITLNSTDFMSVGNKAETRRKIITELNFKNLDVEKYFFNHQHPDIKFKINNFVDDNPDFAIKLLKTIFNGFGPGEILFYFLCNDITLSGFTSQIDTIAENKPFAEIKAAKRIRKGIYGDFRFGGAFSEANYEFLINVRNFINHSENPAILFSELEISASKINELRKLHSCSDEFNILFKLKDDNIFVNNQLVCKKSNIDFAQKIQNAFLTLSEKAPKTFKEIEDNYFSQIEHILNKHIFILFDIKTAKCIYYGPLKIEMLSIERVTQGRIKPLIKI